MFSKRTLAALAVIAGCAALSGASAATPHWPLSLVGNWKGLSNQSPIIVTVTSQTTGANQCNNIAGTIKDVNGGFTGDMLGFYCPSSGVVEFLRYPTGGNVPFQVYTGALSQTAPPAGEAVLIGGVFGQYSLSYGPLGQYSFSLTK